MNELDIYTYGQDILSNNFPEYKNIQDYNIFFRGIFDTYGTIYNKTILNSDLRIEINLTNIEIKSNFLKKVEDLLNIKWKIILNTIIVLKNEEAKKFLDNIYFNSDARYRNQNNYNSYIRWLQNKNISVISFEIEKTLNNTILPIKNNIGLTGEIELTGKIMKIGGLNFKLIGAKKANVNVVYVPYENENDIIEIKSKYPNLIDESFNVKFFNYIDEIIDDVLL
jgi:hypothetical protein